MNDFRGHGLACRRGETLVFKDLDFTLVPGGILVLRGPNGSGKSSLLRLMAGLLRPAEGRLAWAGETLDRDAHGQRLHYLGHLDAVKAVLTAGELVTFWASLRGSAAGVPAALERVGMARLADMPCAFLSAGQKRRLGLARILASPAPLWLLDEPSTALDQGGVAVLEDIIAAHCRDGGMVALSTHSDLAVGQATVLAL